jgi:hypothetical protein
MKSPLKARSLAIAGSALVFLPFTVLKDASGLEWLVLAAGLTSAIAFWIQCNDWAELSSPGRGQA